MSKCELIRVQEPTPPSEHRNTRHCPSCDDTSIRIEDASGLSWLKFLLKCGKCGRHVQTEFSNGDVWEDPEWVAAEEQ